VQWIRLECRYYHVLAVGNMEHHVVQWNGERNHALRSDTGVWELRSMFAYVDDVGQHRYWRWANTAGDCQHRCPVSSGVYQYRRMQWIRLECRYYHVLAVGNMEHHVVQWNGERTHALRSDAGVCELRSFWCTRGKCDYGFWRLWRYKCCMLADVDDVAQHQYWRWANTGVDCQHRCPVSSGVYQYHRMQWIRLECRYYHVLAVGNMEHHVVQWNG